jgi:hypothetical protein
MWDLTTALDLAAKGEPGTKWSKVLDEPDNWSIRQEIAYFL